MFTPSTWGLFHDEIRLARSGSAPERQRAYLQRVEKYHSMVIDTQIAFTSRDGHTPRGPGSSRLSGLDAPAIGGSGHRRPEHGNPLGARRCRYAIKHARRDP